MPRANDTSPSSEELNYLHHPAWAAGYSVALAEVYKRLKRCPHPETDLILEWLTDDLAKDGIS